MDPREISTWAWNKWFAIFLIGANTACLIAMWKLSHSLMKSVAHELFKLYGIYQSCRSENASIYSKLTSWINKTSEREWSEAHTHVHSASIWLVQFMTVKCSPLLEKSPEINLVNLSCKQTRKSAMQVLAPYSLFLYNEQASKPRKEKQICHSNYHLFTWDARCNLK